MTSLLVAVASLSPWANLVIPRPVAFRSAPGKATNLPETVRIGGEPTWLLKVIAQDFGKDGIKAKVVQGKSDITFRLNRQPTEGGKEGYVMRADNGIEITGAAEGLYYGAQTLRQILETYPDKQKSIPAFAIADQPRFPWRGMHLDCSRHFFTVKEIKNYISELARYKMNVFHWHLTDEGGWRMEVKKYPKLTEIGAWRVDQSPEIWNYSKISFPGPKSGAQLYGGYYSQAQIKEVVKYAQDRMVTVVPEIELPGHCLPAVVSYPEVSCTVEKSADRPYRTTAYCAGKEKTFEFLQHVLDETMALFPSKTIHIGGDEVDHYYWEHCPDCQGRMTKEGLKDTGELQSYFVKRIEKYLNSKGRSLMGWDEILEGGLAPNAEVMSWRGIEGGIAAAKAGHRVVMTPTSHCYFDYGYDAIPTERVYAYEPVPAELTEQEGRYVLGAQGNVWTEWMPNVGKVQQMIYPRMLAMAEVLWSPKVERDYADFERRLAPAYARFVREGTNFYTEGPSAEYGLIIMDQETQVAFKVPPIPGLVLKYTTDGSTPSSSSPTYTGAITVREPCLVRVATFMGSKSLGQSAEVLCQRTAAVASHSGLRYKMIAGAFDKLPDFNAVRVTDQGACSDFSLTKWANLPSFAVEFSGHLTIPSAGAYTFKLRSDDGSALRINNALVVDHDGPHGASEKLGKAWLLEGTYSFSLKYFEQGGARSLDATVETPTGPLPLTFFLRQDH